MIDIDAGKRELRRDVLAVRARLTADDMRGTAEDLAAHALEMPALAAARTVAAYVSVGREPGTRPLLAALHDRGTRVLLPVLLPDNDLDWGVYEGEESLVRAGRGLLEPGGPRCGREAVTEADLVLLPGLAVDGTGMRLGRGGGSYDRTLARIGSSGAAPLLAVLLYDSETVGHVPGDVHDCRVDVAVTPSGVREFVV